MPYKSLPRPNNIKEELFYYERSAEHDRGLLRLFMPAANSDTM